MKKIILFILTIVSYFLFNFVNIKAYDSVCNGGEIYADGGKYKVCEGYVYLKPSEKKHSSHLVADVGVEYKTGKILYVGKIDGIDTFYSSGFNYYGVVYDDGPFSNKDSYSDLSINGIIDYSGKFEDNIFIDQSKGSFINFYNEVGNYLIRHYVGGKVDTVIKVVVASKKDFDLGVSSIKYNGYNIGENSVIFDEKGELAFNFSGGKYGFGKFVEITINKCEMKKSYSHTLIVKNEELSSCLKLNDSNIVSVNLYDGLGKSKKFNYSFPIVSDKLKITLENSVSKLITTSRRIVIKAKAGIGDVLDASNCLYYWSENANDKLTYKDFMSNYELSNNKGSYATNNAVILRHSEGTYYLYALAKDSSGEIAVVRSDEYILKKDESLNKATV